MAVGKRIRMSRIFDPSDGRALIVAMDHPAIIGPAGPLADPKAIMSDILSGKPDAILTTKGMIKHGYEPEKGHTGLILKISGGFTILRNPGNFEDLIISSVETGIRYGVDGVAVTVKYGHEREGEFIRQASLVADLCDGWGMPLMIEAWPSGGKMKSPLDPDTVKLCARVSAELGADFVKTFYTGSADSFAEVIKGCPVPVVILGGEEKAEVGEVFEMVEGSLAAGGAGVAMGRNVWGYRDPGRMVCTLRGLIHNGWSVEKALEHLNMG